MSTAPTPRMPRRLCRSAAARLLVTGAVAALALTACAPPGGTTPEVDPGSGAGGEGSGAEQPCFVGNWALDLDRYATDSELYMTGLGIPIQDFAMTGAGIAQFGSDGAADITIEVVSTGTIVVPDASIPVSVPSGYHGAGSWAPRSESDHFDLVDFSEESTATPTEGGAELPAITFAGPSGVEFACVGDTLFLQGPDGVIPSYWNRAG